MRTQRVLALLSGFTVAACGPAGTDTAPVKASAAPPEPAVASPPVATETGRVTGPDGLGVTFEHAAGLDLRPCEDNAPRCRTLVDPTAEPYLRDLLTVQIFDGPLEAVAASEGGFLRNAEGRLMTTYGRFEPVPVERFEVHGKPGMRAVITCGISDPETGFHAAAGECLWAVVSDGRRSAVISSSGFGNGLDAAGVAVPSLRFLPAR